VESDEGESHRGGKRERERERQTERQRERERDGESDSTGLRGHEGARRWRRKRRRRRAFVGGCRSLLRPPGTRGHECLSTMRYDAWIIPPPGSSLNPDIGRSPLFNPSPASRSLHRANAAGSSRSRLD